jgi:hypothetical protein
LSYKKQFKGSHKAAEEYKTTGDSVRAAQAVDGILQAEKQLRQACSVAGISVSALAGKSNRCLKMFIGAVFTIPGSFAAASGTYHTIMPVTVPEQPELDAFQSPKKEFFGQQFSDATRSQILSVIVEMM